MVFYANGLGDAIINRPTFDALCAHLPRPVRLICNHDRGTFLWDGVGFDEILVLDMQREADGGRQFDMASIPEAFIACETFVSLVPWFSRSLDELVATLSPRRSIGFGRGFDISLPLDYTVNSVELGFRVLPALGIDARLSDHRRPLCFGEAQAGRVDHLFKQLRTAGIRKLLAVHTETLPDKQWNTGFFTHVICDILARLDDVAVIVVDYHASGVTCACHGRRMIHAPGLRLESAMDMVSRCDAFLGVDSCMLHAADLAGVPGVLLFGPRTEPAEFGYFWSQGHHLRFRDAHDGTIVGEAIHALLGMLDAPVMATEERQAS
ncbi:glycosyltransferase family 9 protein [Luteibacter anthropi]|uniref:Glycosyltransferase family 9 protein n=1 Tax=Luteibacter anthropi TaxID=564369 RepID=A0A7X5ZJG9_9GAMM|nr:glycosyltransferase family 9 protein [Luteibacter anthropi]